jgi:predicted Zn-dependent protease
VFRIVRRRPFAAGLVLLVVVAGAAVGGARYWARWHVRQAAAALRAGRDADAERHLREHFRVRSSDPDAQFLAARLAWRAGREDEAGDRLDTLERLEGDTDRVRIERLLLRYRHAGTAEQERVLLDRVRNGHPDAGVFLEAVASNQIVRYKFFPAAGSLKKLVELEPENAWGWEMFGWVQAQLGHARAAIDALGKAVALDPDRTDARLQLAELLTEQTLVEDARPHWDRLAGSDRPDVLIGLAKFRLLIGETAVARGLLERVTAADPNNRAAQAARAKVELQANDPVAAERWARQALAGNDTDTVTHYVLLRSLAAQPGREADAAAQKAKYELLEGQRLRRAELVGQLIPQNPTDPRYPAELGDILLAFGLPDQGLYWHARALALDPNYAPSHRSLAAYYEKAGQPARAERHRAALAAGGARP